MFVHWLGMDWPSRCDQVLRVVVMTLSVESNYFAECLRGLFGSAGRTLLQFPQYSQSKEIWGSLGPIDMDHNYPLKYSDG